MGDRKLRPGADGYIERGLRDINTNKHGGRLPLQSPFLPALWDTGSRPRQLCGLSEGRA